ncbi:sodium:solute symporter family protein [Brevibacterium luteolum]|uniref:Sodium:solute symporter family protein n=2 Tax=Brevibacterium luteolum TaxID=199591 RepID=A0A6G8KXE2_9MICO|nr:sodium:solute symporter family protein [Brevibacterium luteolum]QIN29459.1 sodium:solute symporter family protein [Brevibacterium luteolum]
MNWYLVWIIGFLLLLLVISVVATTRVKSADGYVMADFRLGFFPICGSVIATVTGSAALIGGAGKGFEMGLSYNITGVAYASFTIAAVLLLGPVIRRLRLYTVPELFARRFGKVAALIPALIVGLLYMTPTFGMQLVGMGAILASITDLTVFWGILAGFVVTLAFTLVGGMPSVAWTDAIQTFVILAGVIITLIMGINYVGGIGTIIESTPADHFSFTSIGGIELLNWFLIFGPFYIVWQTTWQRLTAAKSDRVGIWAVVIGFAVSVLIGAAAIVIGIASLQMFPADTMPDVIYTSFIAEIFHGSIGGLLMVSLLAALLTGATSFLLSGAINISKDIYQGWVNPRATDDQILTVSRISVAAMAVIGLGIALVIKDIIAIYQVALSFTATTLVMPVLAAMFWKRATKRGVVWSMIAAMAVSLLWRFGGQPFGIHEILPGLITSAIVLIAVSLATRHSDDEVVVAYYHAYRAGELRTHGVDEEPDAAGDVPAGTSTATATSAGPAAAGQAAAPKAEVAADARPARTAEAASPDGQQQRTQVE